MSEHEYRGWKIESVNVNESRPASHAGMGRGEFARYRKTRVYIIHYPEGGTKSATSLKAAKQYIDDYNGWT